MMIDTQNQINNAQSILRNETAKTSKPGGELGKQEFMNLFLTQMSHQNPTDPMDSGTMMSQLSQLGSMEQLQNINGKMGELISLQSDMARFQSLGFIDTDVYASTNEVQMKNALSNPLFFELDQDASKIKVVIETKDGSPVMTRQLGKLEAGKHQFLWDGKDNTGLLMSDGSYNIRFQAAGEDGRYATIKALRSGQVSSIEYKDGKPLAKTQLGMIPLSQILSVDHESKRTLGNLKPLAYEKELPPKGLVTGRIKG